MLRKISDFFLGCIRQVDLVLLALCTGATLFGCLMIASATHYTGSYKNVIVQLAALCLGIVAYVLMSMLDLAEVSKRWKWLLGASLVLIFLLKTPLGMDGGTGNRAWLGVSGFPVNLQPVEIVKLIFIALLARQLVYLQENRDLKSIPSIALLGGHLVLIVGAYAAVSGDMGSALVLMFIFACMCFVAGVAKRWFVIGILGGSFAFYVLWEEDKINPYMKDRFLTLFDHDMDALGIGWQQTRSLMALGMDRSLFGDLMVEDGTAYLLAMPEAAKSLQDEWHEAGHTAIRVRLLDAPPQFTPPQGAQMRDTVASLRLDCVLAAGMSLSRARAAEIIRQGLVQRNHTPEERVDTLLEAGDLLSIRGFGRIRLTEIGGRTRKDRISIQLEVFKRERSS